MKTIRFKEWDCNLVFGKYANGATALQLVDTEDGSPVATASVNIAGESETLDSDEIFIKDWSENEGMLTALIVARVVSHPISHTYTGFVAAPLCEILIPME